METQLVSDSDEDFPIRNTIVHGLLRDIVQKRGMHWYKLSDLAAELRTLQYCFHKQIDVIHYLDGEHSAQYFPSLSKLLRKTRPKIMATYHQPPELLDTLIIKDVVYRLDSITVVSPEQVSYFTEFVAPEKVHLILHGIDIDFFRPDDTPKRDEKFRCITVGHYLRDFNALQEVAKRLSSVKEIEFHVVSSQANELLNLQNVTIYHGIDDHALLKLYQQSDLLFLPLVKSTANNALLEGIACGLPVVSTHLPSVKTYLPGQEAILIKNNDPDRLAEAILHLIDNPDIRRDMARKARQRAKELDWRNIAPLYGKVYCKLTKNTLIYA